MNPNKVKKIAIIALIFAIIGWELPINQGTIWVVNNTNLAPTFAGDSVGLNIRGANNTTYWANNSPIQLMVWGHAASAGATAELHLFINGTKVADTSGRPLGVAEESNKTIIATIPQYANYSVEGNNIHHYEWREYPILTGQVTTNITVSSGTGTGGGCTGNCSFDGVWTNSLRKNDTTDTYGTIINLSSPLGKRDATGNIMSEFRIPNGEYSQMYSFNSSPSPSNYSQVYVSPEEILLETSNGLSTSIRFGHTTIEQYLTGRLITYNNTHVDYDGANITGLNTTTSTGSIFEKRNNAMIGSMSFIDLTPNGGTLLNRTLSLFGLNRIYNEQSLSWTNGTYSSAPGVGFVIDAQNISLGNYPSMKMFYFLPNQTSFTYWFSSTANKTEVIKGNFSINTAGSGITMYSPDGNDWCVTITNAGTLTTSSTPCG